ncbi:MAG: ribosome silencing factor [Nevskiaceae bacterium]|nr:MAG: ribosome silencing factor [Nevskiaceae bacterium]TBR72769.1 MAG: ribosome silencing factor [Nevskiaceae bacterium]
MTKNPSQTEDSTDAPVPRTRKTAKPRTAAKAKPASVRASGAKAKVGVPKAKSGAGKTAAKPRTAAAKAKPKSVAVKPAKTAKPAKPTKAAKSTRSATKAGSKPTARRRKAPAQPSGVLETARTALEDLKAVDLRELDVRSLTPYMDTLLICTGTSNRHVQSLARAVVEKAKAKGFQPHGVEGMSEGEWVLVDLDSVVVHVMQAQARAFYQLEKLWDVSLAPKHHNDVA